MNVHKYSRFGIVVLLSLTGLWVGSRVFTYFTYNSEPEVCVSGIVSGGSYKGTVACSVRGDNGYKISRVLVMLDGEPLAIQGAKSIGSKRFNLDFEFETDELENGKHTLQIESVDSSYYHNKKIEEVEFLVDNTPLKAVFLEPEYKVLQGRTLHPKIQLNKEVESAKVILFSGQYACYPEFDDSMVSSGNRSHEAFIPVDCEQAPGEYVMTLEVKDKVGNLTKLSSPVRVDKVVFPKQKGFSVSSEKLDDEKEVSMNNRILSEALSKWLSNSPKKKLWSGAFEMPTVVQRISTPFGEVRVTPQKGRYLHKAIDIVNMPKSVVWAAQNGRVIIKDRYLFSGNTVVLDHGLGIFTKYFHLDDFADIEVGDFLRKGQPVGKLGVTGYANGYHLHWELTVNGTAVDPVEWTKKVF